MSEWISALQGAPGLAIALALVFGLLIGSFLNVVIARLPRMMEQQWLHECAQALHQSRGEPAGQEPEPPARFNLWTPPSQCPSCGHQIRWYENIPVFSWLFLRARCSNCHTPISWRYPLVELLTAVLFALCVQQFGVTALALAAMLLCAALVALAFIDADTTLLPDQITLPLVWAGLLVNLMGGFVALPTAVIGAMVGYLSLWTVFWIFYFVTGKEGMGFGDFKLFAALGAWMGWQVLIGIILIASITGLLVTLALRMAGRLRRSDSEPQIYIPFGPYLVVGGLVALFAGETLLRFTTP